jgi:rhodanese-related sulfurtransferase
VRDGAQLLDTRDPIAFAAAHLPGSLNIGLGGQYATWAGTLLDAGRPIVLVADPGTEAQSALRLGRIGFDRVEGFLEGGLAAASGVVATDRLSPQTAAERLQHGDTSPLLVDVRTPGERADKTVPGSIHRPLSSLSAAIPDLPRDKPIVVFCAGGYRSSIAASLLQREGFTNVSEVAGGITAWEAAGLPLSGSGQSK